MRAYLPIGIAFLSIFLSWPAKAVNSTTEATNDVILWNNAALQAISDTRSGPTTAARDLSILQTGVFDAWSAYNSHAIGTQLGDQLRRPKEERTLANWSLD